MRSPLTLAVSTEHTCILRSPPYWKIVGESYGNSTQWTLLADHPVIDSGIHVPIDLTLGVLTSSTCKLPGAEYFNFGNFCRSKECLENEDRQFKDNNQEG